MIVSLKIPDDLYQWYGSLNPENPRAAMEQTLLEKMEAFAERAPIRTENEDE